MRYKNLIAGEWRESRSDKTMPNVNPANSKEVLGEVVLSNKGELMAAVEAAAEAFPAWRKTPAPKRGEILFKAQRLMEERKEELARALTLEEGKTLHESRGEVQKAINVLEFTAGEGRRLGGKTLHSELPNTFCYTLKEPLGVVGIITPWNFPVAIPVWKIAPALITGNTVVFKPAEQTPLTAQIVTEIFLAAGVPQGVLNLVHAAGPDTGDVFVNHPAVKAISFTGSNGVGTKLYAEAAAKRKKVLCEMGGKNAVIVLADADLELAASGIAQGAFGSTGQRCTATSRVVVEESVADLLVEKIVMKAKTMKVGSGLESDTSVGPLVDHRAHKKVLGYIEIGKQEGAKLVIGGEAANGPLSDGYFVVPTIFDGVKPHMRIAQEEIFGPVISIVRVKDFDEAIAAANDVEYGLSSSLYTRDSNKVFRYAEEIETGITHVNSPTVGGEAHMPFGGMKSTGIGGREMGTEALEFFVEDKAVYIDYTGAARTTNIY